MENTLESPQGKVRRGRRLTRTVRLVALLMAAGIVGSLAVASPAHASPTGCTWGPYDARASYAVCTGGTGAYRSYTRCRWLLGEYIRYGKWEVPSYPVWSTSSCSWGDNRVAYGIQTS
jgi:hypothetical protein